MYNKRKTEDLKMRKGNKEIISVSLSDQELHYLDNYIKHFETVIGCKLSRSAAIGAILTQCGSGSTTTGGFVTLYQEYFTDKAE